MAPTGARAPRPPDKYEVNGKRWNGKGPTPMAYREWETTEEGKAWRSTHTERSSGDYWPPATPSVEAKPSKPKTKKAPSTVTRAKSKRMPESAKEHEVDGMFFTAKGKRPQAVQAWGNTDEAALWRQETSKAKGEWPKQGELTEWRNASARKRLNSDT